jgi:NAD(P)-dependent dehydrogenase (short-subunit alcohol dehydrogenase family)
VNLPGRVAIVTGASRGIGRQIALALGRNGVRVVVAARTITPHARLGGSIGETVEAIESAGGTSIAVACDLAQPPDLHGLVDRAVARFGGVDLLVNNAADTQGSAAPIDDYPLDSWMHQFAVNVHAPFVLTGLVVPLMRSRGGGVVVNIASSQGDLQPVQASPEQGPIHLGTLLGYATTKAALNRLANALAPTLRDDAIAVVNLDPGFTRTEHVELLAGRDLVDAETAAPMSSTVDTLLRILADPLAHTGTIVRSPAPYRSSDAGIVA